MSWVQISQSRVDAAYRTTGARSIGRFTEEVVGRFWRRRGAVSRGQRLGRGSREEGDSKVTARGLAKGAAIRGQECTCTYCNLKILQYYNSTAMLFNLHVRLCMYIHTCTMYVAMLLGVVQQSHLCTLSISSTSVRVITGIATLVTVARPLASPFLVLRGLD